MTPTIHKKNLNLSTREKDTNRLSGFQGMGLRITFILVVFFILVQPVTADTIYSQGNPHLSAYIFGSNEVNPGDAVTLTVVIQNTGLNSIKYVQNTTAARSDLPNTAKFLRVGLQPGNAPLVVKSDPRMVGDLPGSGEVRTQFSIKVNADAPAGTYTLPLAYNYTYLYTTDQYDQSTLRNTYWTADGTLPITLVIKPDVLVDVLTATPDGINVGTGGYVDMKIRNEGSVFAKSAVVRVLRHDTSPVLPNDSSVYIGDFPPGGIANCRYRVSVLPDAQPQVYPADVAVVYRNDEGDFVTSRSVTIGIPVGGKVDFAIVSDPVVINPGNKRIVSIVYKNTGSATVYSAEARIIAVDPFTTNSDIANLGDLKPGDTATASFGLTADRTALIKEYGLDSEVRYRDRVNNSYVSNTVTVPIDVARPPGISGILSNPVYVSIAVLLIIVAIYVGFTIRRKQLLQRKSQESSEETMDSPKRHER